MLALVFSLKRAFHKSNAVTRSMLSGFGLTGSRFDMLYVIWMERRRWIFQSDLRRALGVSAATVSRMLKSLKELGLVQSLPRLHGDRDPVARKLTLSPLGN